MTDRELLGLAAKAAELEVEWLPHLNAFYRRDVTWPSNEGWFDPLNSDRDAFRLAVKLRLLVGIHLEESWAQSYGTPEGEWITIREKNGDDPRKAARRVIVRVAAEIAAIAASAKKTR